MTLTLDEECLLAAADQGDALGIRLAIKKGDCLKSMFSSALRRAALAGHVECVELLIPVSDPKEGASRALSLAARNGHLAIAKMLLPVSEPLAGSSLALRWAAMNGHLAIADLLLTRSAVDLVRMELAASGHAEALVLLESLIQAKDLRMKNLRPGRTGRGDATL